MVRTTLSTRPHRRPGARWLAVVATVAATILIGPAATLAAGPTTNPSNGDTATGARPAAPAPAPAPAAPGTAPVGAGSAPVGPGTATGRPGAAATTPGRTVGRPAPPGKPAAEETEPPVRTSTRTAPPQAPRPGRTCGGVLPLGTVVTCAAIVDTQQHRWTVTTPADQDILVTQLTRGSGDHAQGWVTDSAGAHVCWFGVDSDSCQLGPAGTYTVTVKLPYPTGRGDYTLAVESTRAPSTCRELPESFFSFASPGVTGTLAAGTAAHCFRFDQPVHSVLRTYDPSGEFDVRGQVLDADFQPLCEVRYVDRCTLDRRGPYRILLREQYGTASAYTLRMPRLSHPVGCPAVPLAPFGDPGAAVGSGTVSQQEEVGCHVVTTPAAGPLLVRLNQYHDQYLAWTMYDAAGDQVCSEYDPGRGCPVPAAGSYTLLMLNRNDFGTAIDYQVAVTRLDHTDGCAPTTGTSWDQAALRLHQTSQVQTNCQPFTGTAGQRMVTYVAPDRYNDAWAWLVDSAGTAICTGSSDEEEDGCVLPATGTYRVIAYLSWWQTDSVDLTYRLQVRRLSDPAGCPTITPGGYDAAPAGALGGIRCRILDLPAAGTYRVKAMTDDNYRRYGNVYDSTGHKLCTGISCAVPAAGRYTLVLDGSMTRTVIDNDAQHAFALLPWQVTGCPTVSDTGWRDAPQQGTFEVPAQYRCLRLPSPAGARVVGLLPGDATEATTPEMSVVDATGDEVCDYYSLRQYACALTGPAPHSVLLSARDGYPSTSYTFGVARVDGPPACPVLAGDAAGSTVTTGPDRFAVCLSVPADQHAARQSFTWSRTAGAGDARLSVFDAQGVRYCGPSGYSVGRTITCSLPAGPVTVLLESDALDASYRITHAPAG
ncbi:hypothetical protein [Micromonospora rifamycinica]|uniref:hypothetical protein n=1 Tax=Micromonospora rifamycinica TaxID=291594 RepID=UPI00076C402D|nr:hypothetical protein [Micromonospora rifamycinica]KWV31594.1 hypothetical protein AWV63_16805 [Micromonospora rifamycinica]